MTSFRMIHVLVEGQTEERIVSAVLRRVFAPELVLNPVLVTTRRRAGQPHGKGGVSHWVKIQDDIKRLLKDSSATVVTTMLDFYGLPSDTPGCADISGISDPYARVEHIEEAMAATIDHPRFIPFLALHEAEAWVLAAAHELAELIERPELEAPLARAVTAAGGAELVNNGPSTAPSKRILEAYPEYQKVVDGPDAIDLLGVADLRAACPHFDSWMRKLETCGTSKPS